MHLIGLRGYGIGIYAIVAVVVVLMMWPARLLREESFADLPGWAAQLMLWWTIAAANLAFSRWLDHRDGGVVATDPADPKRFIVVKPEQHTALWIPVRHWTWIFILVGVYGSFVTWSARS